MTDKLYRLCYVSGNIMYFTDNFENQTGDDWDDAPYEHNAGEPYEWVDEWSAESNKYRGHIRMIAFMTDRWLDYPCDGYGNSPFSVDDINAGAIAWIRVHKGGNSVERQRWIENHKERVKMQFRGWLKEKHE